MQPVSGLIFVSLSGIPEAVISWGESERIVSNGTSLLNSWEGEIYQVVDTDILPAVCSIMWVELCFLPIKVKISLIKFPLRIA